MSSPLPLALFDYALPAAQIAQRPAEPRDHSRLMALRQGVRSHHRFLELPELLQPGDLLVLNTTRVIPARLRGQRETGGKVELLFHRPLGEPLATARRFLAMGKPGKALKPGVRVRAPDGSVLVVIDRRGRDVVLEASEPLLALLERAGEVPLPPYIERPEGPQGEDRERYQTVFAQQPGSSAAPTASLHFTGELLSRLAAMGVQQAQVVLHVGPGTFLPVPQEHEDDVRAHELHAEWYEVPEAAQATIERARSEGRRVIAVGTTVVRTLEACLRSGAPSGETALFIYPGQRIGAVDGMITNFHLPRSTLLMLVAAFAGLEVTMEAYRDAVAQGYRFFSYGDAMLILP